MLALHSPRLASLSFALVRVCLAGAALSLGACDPEFDCAYSCPGDQHLSPEKTRTAVDSDDARYMCELKQRSEDVCEQGLAQCKCVYAGQELADVFTLAITPSTLDLRPGEPATFVVELLANADIKSQVLFQLEGLPEPFFESFSPESVLSPRPRTALTVGDRARGLRQHRGERLPARGEGRASVPHALGRPDGHS